MKDWLNFFHKRALRLRARFLLLLFSIITFILAGQTFVTLSREVVEIDNRISTQGTIIAQSIAMGALSLMDYQNPDRFHDLIERARERVNLVELSIANKYGLVIAHTDPNRIGEKQEQFGNVFTIQKTTTKWSDVFKGYTEYEGSAPILRNLQLIGRVYLKFRSDEVARGITRHLLSAVSIGFLWLFIGGLAGAWYIRRITRPIEALTEAATSISKARLDEVKLEEPKTEDEVGVLQNSFIHLVKALRAGETENERLLAELKEMNAKLNEKVSEMTVDLRNTATYLQSVIHCMEEGVITCDRDGTIVQANQGSRRQLAGFMLPQPGIKISELIPDGQCLADAVDKAFETGTRTELKVDRSSGSSSSVLATQIGDFPERRHLSFSVYPLRDPDGSSLGVLVTVIDETEKHQIEARLRRHERLISLGTISGGLAHELGNCMHAITGFSKLLLDSLAEGDPKRADAKQIHDENARAVALLKRFLEFARPGKMVFQRQSIERIIQEAIGLCAYQAKQNGVNVVFEPKSDGKEYDCDAQLLRQVFVNLILNAVDSMTGRSEKRLAISTRIEGAKYFEVTLSDTGCGIAPQHLERIFDPFFTTKQDKGTGLGLSIAHKIVDTHGGTITVHSEVGRGSIFTIRLPVNQPRESSV
ncbi:MAG: PAS domain-containing protein [Deltaproteobacteria bacterium]|nr:PAS domain-containing protein [Deltaproteobacteria bacterium]